VIRPQTRALNANTRHKSPSRTPEADFKRMLEIGADTVAFIQREVDQQRMKPVAAQPAGMVD